MRRKRYEAVVIAASTGGIEALRTVLGKLEPRIAAPVVIVQHTASEEGQALCDALAAGSAVPVVEAEPRQPLVKGCAYLAPPGYHLLIEPGPRAALSMDEKVCHVRPSADVLFTSAADVWRSGLIGVVLTGANEDGAAGMVAIRGRKGLAVVQKPEEAEMREMPEATLQLAGADHVLSLSEIGPLLNRLCR